MRRARSSAFPGHRITSRTTRTPSTSRPHRGSSSRRSRRQRGSVIGGHVNRRVDTRECGVRASGSPRTDDTRDRRRAVQQPAQRLTPLRGIFAKDPPRRTRHPRHRPSPTDTGCCRAEAATDKNGEAAAPPAGEPKVLRMGTMTETIETLARRWAMTSSTTCARQCWGRADPGRRML